MSKLEKEYQEIKIPDELKGRVIQAMQEARNDAKAEPDASDKKMEEDPRMNRIRRKQKDKNGSPLSAQDNTDRSGSSARHHGPG